MSSSAAYAGPVGSHKKKRSLEGVHHQGFSGVEAIGIQITNHGPAPVTIEKITLFPRGGTMSLVPLGELIGPDLSYKFEPGANSTWYVDYIHEIKLITSSREVLGEQVTGVYMSAQLGAGKSIKTRRTIHA
ncbi:phosphoribosylamine--glycine ligase [Arthrobacter sp. MYb222]|uniref:phosphoribosylamine--glycine ligase n=1 Tax=Arthrobacter sp. MYb222 TaxID=1848599 RepID=UPI001C611608|nr:phosphoribosylamine--glycine ligase [Arthrobacter sp. MYb222]